MAPQTIGPDLDLLEKYQLVNKSREDRTTGIPSTFYITNLKYILSLIDLTSAESTMLREYLEFLRPLFLSLKEYQKGIYRDFQLNSLNEIYATVLPLNLRMLVLQFLISVLLVSALIFHDQIQFFSEFQKDQLPFNDYVSYSTKLREFFDKTVLARIANWISSRSTEINQLHENVWNQFYKDFFLTSVFKEPLTSIVQYIDKIEKQEQKENQIRQVIERIKMQSGLLLKVDFKRSEDLKDYEKRIKQQVQTILSQAIVSFNKAMKHFIKNANYRNRINKLRSRVTSLKTQLTKLIIREIKHKEVRRISAEIMNVLFIQASILLNLSARLEEQLEDMVETSLLIQEINKAVSDLTTLLNLRIQIMPELNQAKNVANQLREEFTHILDEFQVADQNSILKLINETGKITLTMIIKSLNWSQERARHALKELVKNKILVHDSSHSKGEIWYLKEPS